LIVKKLNAWERFLLFVAPGFALSRMQARQAATVFARHYEAAQLGRRTSGWYRSRGDANAVTGSAISELRTHARDLIRNNSWARRAQRIIANNTVGWGIVPKAIGADAAAAQLLWKQWAESLEVETEGRHTLYSLQQQVMRVLASDGEVLIRRRRRQSKDGLLLPMQLQLMEADYIDTNKDGERGQSGGQIIQGIEYDAIGRRAAYWLFPEHPGSDNSTGQNVSKRVPAEDILHVFYQERPGQSRGVSWFASAIVNLKDFDEWEDAELMKQKIAACFAVFVTDLDGTAPALGTEDPDDASIDSLEPGMIENLPAGKDVKFASPPPVTVDSFAARQLRRVAAGLGVTYEDLTGDYSQVNFSSARMGRLSHQANVRDWQNNVLIPQFCTGVWRWFVEAAVASGALRGVSVAEWTVPALPMLEPDREGLAYQRLVRVGAMTPSEMVREQGFDPEAHWKQYAADLAKLDELGIILDADARAVTQSGLTQQRAGGTSGAPSSDSSNSSPDAARTIETSSDEEINIRAEEIP